MESGRRRYAILTEGYLADRHAKTAHGVIRYGRDDVAAVIDSSFAGRDVADVMPILGRRAPIVAGLRQAMEYEPTALLVGVATAGGVVPPEFRHQIVQAIDAGLEIVSGLHDLLRDDEEFVAHAGRSGARLWDVRLPPADIPLFSGAAYAAPSIVALAVGSDCAIGKMSAMLELQRSACAAGAKAEFVATGQTGIMIAGRGIAVDRVIADFVSGAAEQLVLGVSPAADFALVEGQGSIFHPAYAPVTLGLMYGSAPDLLVLCHRADRTTIDEFDIPIPDLPALVRAHEALLAPVKAAPCVALALNTSALDDAAARSAIARAQAQTGLPTDDAVRYGGAKLWRALVEAASRTRKRRAAETVLTKG
ncbi:MAG: DUF1611 domain-containing protein [Candidatus Eremiobacteraeota bacterium]|nr:DUF1611 domain-containing protein [Candidatus Eremiobacteraeota bacterium]MBC5827184.1 DUF1611 domain-containing protein [Candidatus Eremiobacteraeota bacterium]